MYRKRAEGWLKHFDFLLWESVSFQLAFCFSFFLRHGWGNNPYMSLLYRNTALVAEIFLIIVITWMNTFSGVLRRGFYKEFLSTAKTVLSVMLSLVLYLFVTQQGESFSRLLFFAWGIFYLCFSFFLRSVWKYFLQGRVDFGKNVRSMILVTTNANVATLVQRIQEQNPLDYKITGVILRDGGKKADIVSSVPTVIDLEHAEEYLCHHWVDEVFLDLPERDPCRQELVSLLMDMGIVVHQRIGSEGDTFGKMSSVQTLANYPVLTMSSRILTVRETSSKRLLDICGGIVGCFFTILLFLVIAPVIYLHSPGPVIFSQERVGRNGRRFRLYKFRSMYLDAEERKAELYARNEVKDGMMFKVTDDPRIIGSEKGPGKGIGNFIRRTSLDEFPQFFNVLKGEMSLVGTRPPTLDEWERYEARHRDRMSIKPGITGLWQVSGRSEVNDFEEVILLDKEYIENWTFGMDLKILFKTVAVVLTKQGAK